MVLRLRWGDLNRAAAPWSWGQRSPRGLGSQAATLEELKHEIERPRRPARDLEGHGCHLWSAAQGEGCRSSLPKCFD